MYTENDDVEYICWWICTWGWRCLLRYCPWNVPCIKNNNGNWNALFMIICWCYGCSCNHAYVRVHVHILVFVVVIYFFGIVVSWKIDFCLVFPENLFFIHVNIDGFCCDWEGRSCIYIPNCGICNQNAHHMPSYFHLSTWCIYLTVTVILTTRYKNYSWSFSKFFVTPLMIE